MNLRLYRRLLAVNILAPIAITLLSCDAYGAATPKPSDSGLNLSSIDRNYDPSQDFYDYANGNWLAKTPIPSDHPELDSFIILHDENSLELHQIAIDASMDKHSPPHSPSGLVGSFYRSAMDVSRIEADGYLPLQPELNRINCISNGQSLMAEIGRLHRIGVRAAFGFYSEQDPADSSSDIASIGQGGLGLPEPGYYSRADSASVAIRAAYVAYATNVFTFLGELQSEASADAATALSAETQLAAVSKSPQDLRDPIANYHRMSFASLKSLCPATDWQSYFDAIHLSKPGLIDVSQPSFFMGLNGMVASLPLNDWKTYLKWDLINAEATRLSSNFDTAHFAFYSQLLNGIPAEPVRWKRSVAAIDREVGDALGQLYVQQYFPPPAKRRALALVMNLKATLRSDIKTLPWMGPSTKLAALHKIDTMTVKIGYPDHWRDYSKLDLTSPSYVINCMRADELKFQHNLNEIGKPVDRTEWGMSAPTVNAYYDASMNSINFPAGILQPPFFNPGADDAVNYGAIGAVIGHEMTHGFDDDGRQYDYRGNLHGWWTPTDLKNFNVRKQGIIDQYSSYEPLTGQFIDGKLTTGENIADIGGFKIAYLALEKSLAGKPKELVGGYTPEQQFFLSFAQMYRNVERPEYAGEMLRIDPHSPDRFRVKGVLADTPEFKLAFPGKNSGSGSATTIW
jgi:putative endopeptidase